MLTHSKQQLDILRKMGVEVWKLRAADRSPALQSQSQQQSSPQPQPQPVAEASTSAHRARVVAATAAQAAQPESPDQPAAAQEDAQPSLQRVAQAVAACQKCELHRHRANTVFGCGSSNADWLLVGEAPGQHEDLQGQPFVGRAGKLLDMMIAALGMQREQVFIANILKCRPPNNRDPLPAEVAQCEPYLHQQLALIKPKVIVALGRISAQTLLRSTQPLAKLRAQTHHYGANNIPLVVTYHPAYLLRSPQQKAAAWEDLWQAREIVRQ